MCPPPPTDSERSHMGQGSTTPVATMNGIRFFLAAMTRPCRDFDKTNPLAPVNAMAGIRMKSPGITIKAFIKAMVPGVPNSSENSVAQKKLAIVSVASKPAKNGFVASSLALPLAHYGPTQRLGTAKRLKRCGEATADVGYCSSTFWKSGWVNAARKCATDSQTA